MDELFSCRNCIHNAGQSLHIGNGAGFCLKHDSIIRDGKRTTCKYLHRSDLPRFAVDEGIREHAAEFASFSGLVDLATRKPVDRIPYSERFAWKRRTFDPVTHALAQYYKADPSWIFIQTFTSGLDGRRALTHCGLVRRYMDRCGTWQSSYRLVLELVEEIHIAPCFDDGALFRDDDSSVEDAREQALWDVVFSKLSAIQEYGFHSGVEEFMWITDSLNGGLSQLDWNILEVEMTDKRPSWIETIITHAEREKVFFPEPEESPREEPFD